MWGWPGRFAEMLYDSTRPMFLKDISDQFQAYEAACDLTAIFLFDSAVQEPIPATMRVPDCRAIAAFIFEGATPGILTMMRGQPC